jgi:hypothetical protein
MKLTRILSLVLVVLMLTACLASCAFVDGFKQMFGIDQQPTESGEPAIPENQEYKLVSNGAPQYVVVYDYKAGPQTKNAIIKMVDAFATYLGCSIEAKECYIDREVDEDFVQEKEILIGNTNRPESAIVADGKKANDYDIDIINGKVVIAGGSDAATAKAVSTFMAGFVYEQGDKPGVESGKKMSLMIYKNIVDENNDNNRFDVDEDDFSGTGIYSYNAATMANARLDSYLMVYARDGAQKDTSRAFATELQAYIAKEVGFELDMKKDAAVIRADYKIVVGDTTFTDDAFAESLGDDEYYIALTAEEEGATLNIQFGANAYEAAMNAFKRIMPHSASPIDFNMSAGFVETNMANPPKAE